MRDASEDLHQRAAAIRLGLALDNVDPSRASDATKEHLYQAIIAYRKSAKHIPTEERQSLERRIAKYSNSLAKK